MQWRFGEERAGKEVDGRENENMKEACALYNSEEENLSSSGTTTRRDRNSWCSLCLRAFHSIANCTAALLHDREIQSCILQCQSLFPVFGLLSIGFLPNPFFFKPQVTPFVGVLVCSTAFFTSFNSPRFVATWELHAAIAPLADFLRYTVIRTPISATNSAFHSRCNKARLMVQRVFFSLPWLDLL